ncbi:MAG: hypothetical protein RR623_09035, partial [Bacilli bacterium]
MENKNEITDKSYLVKWVDEKTSIIITTLEAFFADKKYIKKLATMNLHPFFINLLSKNNDYGNMERRTFNEPEEVLHCLECYQQIMARINLEYILVPSKENFCNFMGWTTKIYSNVLLDSTSDIRDVMSMVDDFIIESQFNAGMSGFAKANLSKTRLQTSGEHGSSLVTQKEQSDIDQNRDKLKTKE